MTGTIDPLVSTDWLDAHLAGGLPPDLMIVDIRESRLYEAGHIPGSVCIPFSPMSVWAVSDDELLMELPPDEDLFALLEDWGIAPGKTVILVGTVDPAPAPPYALADAPRVAATLFHVGVEDVAILDGGYPKWAAEGRVSTRDVIAPATLAGSGVAGYEGATTPGLFVSTEYVKERLGRAVLIDGRDADQYFGVAPCPFAGVGGHIPTARSLPTPWIWNPDGTYKPNEVLRAMVEGVVGPDREQEIIAYCGVGGYASVWWFVPTRILGYHDVKIYDGAAEAWVKTEPMVSYGW